jgi:hypothetical protein
MLLLLRVQGTHEILPRVIQQARCVQLPLLMWCMTPPEGRQNLGHLVPAIESAYRALEAIDCMQGGFAASNDVDGSEDNCESFRIRARETESGLQQLRDTLAALSRALHCVPQLGTSIEGNSGSDAAGDDLGAVAVAACSRMLSDGIYSVAQGRGLLRQIISGTCEDITHAIASVDSSSAAAAVASASAATFSSALESERSARAAADIKVALLQRECQNMRDHEGRSLAAAAAASSSINTQLQSMTSEMALLQVIFFFAQTAGMSLKQGL